MGFEDKFDKHIDLETFDKEKAAKSMIPTGGLPIPPGEYRFRIAECEDKKTTKGGEMRAMKLEIAEGSQENRAVYQNFVYDCGNDNVEKIAIEQIMAIWIASGGDPKTKPGAGAMIGREFIGLTSVEFNDYKEGRYVPLLAGVEYDRKKKPLGEFEDDKKPSIWFDCVEFYQNGGGKKKAKKPVSKSFDEDDVPF